MESTQGLPGMIDTRGKTVLRTTSGSSLPSGSRRPPRLPTVAGLSGSTAEARIADTLSFALRRAQLAVFADLHHALAEVSLRPIQYAALVLIGEYTGASQRQVSAALGVEKANFVAIIAELEQRGLVTRQKLASDARTYRLSLSPAGQALRDEAIRHQDRHESKITAALGEQSYRDLLRMLDRLSNAV